MKSEGSCGALCQHPECWRANVQKAKDAVRLRNGIQSHQTLNKKDFGILDERESHNKDGSLPTLKVVNMFGETDLRANSAPHSKSPQPIRYHNRSTSLPSLSPDPSSQPLSPSCTPATGRVPRPSPVSPTVLTEYQKRMLWKTNLQPVQEPTDESCDKGHPSIVGVHELYENDELLQDWKDVYITSAYLIWCQTNRRKKRKAKSTGSIRRKDPHRVTFKDHTEDMIPAEMEKIKPKRPEPRRSPTVGQPYSPSRTNPHRQVHVQQLDLTKYGLEDFGDFPKSVIAGILQHLKPRSVAPDKELPLGLEAQPKQQSSPRAGEIGAKKQLNSADVAEKSLEETLHDENSRMLLDIDINSHFTPPVEEEITDEEGGDEKLGDLKQGAKPEPNMIKAVSEKLAARQGRVLLPLPLVGVPTQCEPKVKLHHCTNSIPCNLDLGVAMEPVDVVSVTPTPTGTPAEETTQESHLCVLDHSSLDMTLAPSELDDQWPVRGHITSALRYSPTPVRAPAPTPISPERYGQYSRTPHTREYSNSIASRQMRRWETLSSVNDQDEAEFTRENRRGSPEGEGNDVSVEPVFLTENVLSRDPNLTSLLVRKDAEEWPQEKMIINIIENVGEIQRSLRSPSPGSKTYIPHDILAEFHGDLYGRSEMHIAGQKMMGKSMLSTESQLSTEVPRYIAPAWRTPRSRTPIQFSETPGRKAPKPLRQPPADSVPKSLSVKSLVGRTLRRPKSTPPRLSSSRGLPMQQILSDSSLINSSRDDTDTYSMAVQASSPSVDTRGAIPPPPSPEVLMVAPVVTRLDPVNEAEEKSSIASVSVADGTSQVEGGNTVANLSEVEEEDEDVELSQQPDKVELKGKEEEQTAAEITAASEQNKEADEPQNLTSQPANEESLSVAVDKQLLPSEAVSSEALQDQTQALAQEAECEILNEEPGHQGYESKEQDAILAERNTAAEELRDEKQQEATVPPHPPGSPDVVSTPDFTEGLDMSLDLEAELRAAMQGLDDLDDNRDGNEKPGSPALEAW